jgi:hypothetical protein
MYRLEALPHIRRFAEHCLQTPELSGGFRHRKIAPPLACQEVENSVPTSGLVARHLRDTVLKNVVLTSSKSALTCLQHSEGRGIYLLFNWYK